MKAHIGTVIAVLIISIVGIISLSWFQGNYLISAIDFSMPFDRIKSFTANFYSWDSQSLGSANPRILAFNFPVFFYFAFSEIIGLSLVNTEKILFYGVFAISGLSMYYLTTTLLGTKSSKFKNLAGLISGLFYMLNPYVALNILPVRQVSYMVIYALLPLFLGIFAKFLNKKRNVQSAIIVAIVMLLATSAFVDPSFVPLIFLPLLIYLIFFIITNPKKTVMYSAFKFSLSFAIAWSLLNLYWLLPDLNSYSSELGKVSSAYASVGMSFQSIIELNSAPFLGAVRLLGLWSLNAGYRGDSYILWAIVYQNPILIAIGILIPVLAFMPLLLKSRDKHVIFFSSFAVIGLILIVGSYSPLGNWIYRYVPLFGVLFNTPYARFGMYLTLAYAFLIGYALAKLFGCLSSNFQKNHHITRRIQSGFPVVLILFLILGGYAFPLWTGQVVRPSTSVLQGNRYQLPSYYQDASKWLGSDSSEFNIIIFPISTLGYGELKWVNGGYDGPYPAASLFPKTLITSSSAGNGLAGEAAQLIIGNSTEGAGKLLTLLNVKYVMFNEDANWAYIENNTSWISCSSEQFQAILNSTGVFTLEKTFGQLTFFRNNYWQPTKVYPGSTGILSNGYSTQLIQIVGRHDFTPSDSMIALSSQLNAQQTSDLPMNAIFIQNPENIQPFMTAKYYSGWRQIISTNGTGDPGAIVFPSPSKCPYLDAFPMRFTNWSGYDSTLIYVTTSSSPLTINSLIANGVSVPGQAWWQTGTSWITGWPITIPSNQNAIIQLNQRASNIKLQTDNGLISLTVTNGWVNPLTPENPSETPTAIVTANSGDYLIAVNVTTGHSYGNLSVKVDNQSFTLGLNSQEQELIFAYKYIGPLFLSAGSHVITIVAASDGNVSMPQIDSLFLYSLENGESFVNATDVLSSCQQNNASLTYQEFSPTQYKVHVNSSSPFYLVFSESYDNGWIATINGQQIPEQYHFTANGYANGWYVNKTGTYDVILEYTPQNLFYAGAAISITTLIICTIYVTKNKIKTHIKNILRKTSQ